MSENAESQTTIYPTIAAMLRDGICGGYYTCNGRRSTRYAYARINRAIARGAPSPAKQSGAGRGDRGGTRTP